MKPKPISTLRNGGRMKKLNVGEEAFALQLRAEKIPFKREYRFCERRWKFDFAFPERMFAVEIEGGIWSRGRHTRPQGYINDMEKYNAASALGWKVWRFTPEQIKSGIPIKTVSDFFYPKTAKENINEI